MQDYSNHIAEIESKMVSIMETPMTDMVVRWSTQLSLRSAGSSSPREPDASLARLTKDLLKMHEAIACHLPLTQVQVYCTCAST